MVFPASTPFVVTATASPELLFVEFPSCPLVPVPQQ